MQHFVKRDYGYLRKIGGIAACGITMLFVNSSLIAQNQVCIDFETGGPCAFSDTTALRDAFADQGINFAGPLTGDGGGILDQCGGFGVNARSGVNFLAFNGGATFSDGGIPRDPETVLFDSSVTAVSIWVSGGVFNANWTMDAFDGGGNLITSAFASSTAGTYSELNLNGSGIRSVVISENSGAAYFVMDDLCVDFEAADCLTMTVSALTGGQTASWDVSGATAGSVVAVVYGMQAGSTVVNGQMGFCATFGIQGVSQNSLVGTAAADGSGNASVTKMIPAVASGLTVLTQAAEQGTCPNECVSNLDTQVVQ